MKKSQWILTIYTVDLKTYVSWKQKDGQNIS